MSEKIAKIIGEQKKELKLDSSIAVDKKSPFTGNLKLRGKTFQGIVVSKDTHRTVRVEWTTKYFVKKYERFSVKKTKVAAHNPDEINANVGDLVIIAECRPLSKTKNFVVIKNLGKSSDYIIKQSNIEQDKEVSKESKKDKKDEVNVEESTQSENLKE